MAADVQAEAEVVTKGLVRRWLSRKDLLIGDFLGPPMGLGRADHGVPRRREAQIMIGLARAGVASLMPEHQSTNRACPHYLPS